MSVLQFLPCFDLCLWKYGALMMIMLIFSFVCSVDFAEPYDSEVRKNSLSLWHSFFSCGTVFFLWHSFNFGCFIRLIPAISVQNQNMVWRKNILTGYTNLRESCNLIYVLWKNIHLHIWSDLCICRCSGSKNCVGNNIKWRKKEKSAKPMFCGKSKFVVFPLGGRSVRECRRWVCAIC